MSAPNFLHTLTLTDLDAARVIPMKDAPPAFDKFEVEFITYAKLCGSHDWFGKEVVVSDETPPPAPPANYREYLSQHILSLVMERTKADITQMVLNALNEDGLKRHDQYRTIRNHAFALAAMARAGKLHGFALVRQSFDVISRRYPELRPFFAIAKASHTPWQN